MGYVFAVAAGLASPSYASPPMPQEGVSPDRTQASQGDRPVEAKQPSSTGVEKTLESPRAGDGREKQIAKDSARLLELAAELKAEADKTTIDTLSLTIIRRAEEIENLARTVKKEIKDGQTVEARGKR